MHSCPPCFEFPGLCLLANCMAFALKKFPRSPNQLYQALSDAYKLHLCSFTDVYRSFLCGEPCLSNVHQEVFRSSNFHKNARGCSIRHLSSLPDKRPGFEDLSGQIAQAGIDRKPRAKNKMRYDVKNSNSEKRDRSKRNFYSNEVNQVEHILDCLRRMDSAPISDAHDDENTDPQSRIENELQNCDFPIKDFHAKNVLRALSSPSLAFEFYRWVKRRPEYIDNKYVLTLVMKILSEAKMVKAVEWILEDMEKGDVKKDLLIWTEVIRCYANINETEKAAQALVQMVDCGTRPDAVVFNILITSHFRKGELDEALSAFRLMRRLRLPGNTQLYTTIMTIFKLKRKFVEAEAVFKEMTISELKPDIVTFELMINIYLKWGKEDAAMELFNRILGEGLKLSNYCCTRIMEIYRRRGMKKEHDDLRLKLFPGIPFKHSKINFSNCKEDMRILIKNGRVKDVEMMYEELEKNAHDVVLYKSTYRLLFWGFLREKKFDKMKTVVDDLKTKGILPDLAFYTYLLLACSNPEYEDYLNNIWELMERTQDPMHNFLPLLLQLNDAKEYKDNQLAESCHEYILKLSKTGGAQRMLYCNALVTFLCKAKKYGSVSLLWQLIRKHDCYHNVIFRSNFMHLNLRKLLVAPSLVCLIVEFSELRDRIFHSKLEPPEQIRISLRNKLEVVSSDVCVNSSVSNFLKCLKSPFISPERNENILLAGGSQVCYWLSHNDTYLGLDLLDNQRLI